MRHSTASMTWRIERLIAFLSRMVFQPGDVVWTGGVSPRYGQDRDEHARSSPST
jgi:2-keto-4-pentenoate hydratase/2-oxohepta-3-ene-1,7-dioic acid hydratase in catechol pathway